MRFTIERLRSSILVAGVVLVLALAGFFAYGRYRVRQIGHDLPAKLGLEIQQSTNNFTISKSKAGRTLFVLRAAKAVQYKGGGHAVLHDVSIEIFGKDGKSADRITGSEFNYDPTGKIARADGPVEIELTNPASLQKQKLKKQTGPAGGTERTVSRVPIEVKTSGLVFHQDTEIATTEQTLTFRRGDDTGSARGATYDSGQGTLLLSHDVALHSVIDGRPVQVTADGANFDRDNHRLLLVKQRTDYDDRHASSDQATVFFREDGGADHITAEGNVHLMTEDGDDLRATNGMALLNAGGLVEQVRLAGGLLFVSHDAARSLHLNSTAGVFTFAPTGKNAGVQKSGTKNSPTHLQLTGAVSAVEQELSLAGDPHGSETRESRASQMDIDLAAGENGKVQPTSILAKGSASFLVHTIRERAPQEITRLQGDQIYAALADGHVLSSVRANGNTSLEQSTPGGIDRTSTGDELQVQFAPPGSGLPQRDRAGRGTARTQVAGGQLGSRIASAVQQGHARLVQLEPAKNGSSEAVKTTASADVVHYDGATDTIELRGGSPRIAQGEGDELTASDIVFHRGSGDAVASGGIKATYTNAGGAKGQGGGEAMHVVADHATLDHASGETVFYGAAHADARLWQGANAVTAPQIALSRSRQLLTASGPATSVRAVLLENAPPAHGGDAKPTAGSGGAGAAGAGSHPVVRTTSTRLSYSGGERKATLTGGVVVEDPSGTMRANTVELFLNPSGPPGAKSGEKPAVRPGVPPANATMSPGGQVERLVADGHVQLTQGDRSGSGERLVYTAEDGHFVLTGGSASPPRITDPQHGTVSGASLLFNNRDDSVVVSHGVAPTTTDTRTVNEGKRGGKPLP